MKETKFKIVLHKDMTYGVEVWIAGRGAPYTVDTFATEAEAQAWVEEWQRLKDIPEKPAGRIPRPRGPLALAKLIGDIASSQVEDVNEDGKNANATNLGRLGGGARARALTPERRAEIATKAAAKR